MRPRPLASGPMLRSSLAVGALAALVCAGCASAPAPAASAPPRLVLAEVTPASGALAVPTGPGTTEPAQESDSEHKDRQMNRVWGWFALSVGIDAGILAIVTSGMMVHQADVRSADCSHKVCSADGIAANGKLGSLAPWNAGAWTLTVVGVGVGAFVLLTNPSDKALGTQVVVGQTGSGSGVLVQGVF